MYVRVHTVCSFICTLSDINNMHVPLTLLRSHVLYNRYCTRTSTYSNTRTVHVHVALNYCSSLPVHPRLSDPPGAHISRCQLRRTQHV